MEPPATAEDADPALVARFRAGDSRAFGALVDRHGPSLYRFLVGWLRAPDLAEELAQASLVKAAVRIDQLEDGQSFLAWLLRIARTTALDHLRANPRERAQPLDDHDRPVRSSPDVVLDVRRVLAALDDDDREALILSDYLALTTHELAHTLDLSLSAAKMRVHRARARFRALYEGATP